MDVLSSFRGAGADGDVRAEWWGSRWSPVCARDVCLAMNDAIIARGSLLRRVPRWLGRRQVWVGVRAAAAEGS